MALEGLRPISTPRLRLRGFVESDASARLRYQGREDVSRFLRRAPHTAETVILGMRRNVEGRFEEDQDRLLYAVEQQERHELIGEVSARLTSAHDRQVELSWVFDPASGGNGYATEAVRAAMADLLDRRGVHRTVARVDPRNEASVRLCRRVGMRLEGTMHENELHDGEWLSEHLFAALRRDLTGTP